MPPPSEVVLVDVPVLGRSERAIIFLIAAVQFVNILDFVMVMPMGPDFARALGIAESKLGFIGGSYTAAAAIAGLLGSVVLDRFDRRKVLGVAMAGLVCGTVAGGFAQGFGTLLLARVVAGFFGGPATAVSFAIISDVVPAARRGKAVGTVMTAFSIASVLGVPAGLWLAEQFGWRMPFFAVGGLGLVLAVGSLVLLPSLTLHLKRTAGPRTSTRELLSRPLVRVSYLMTAVVMMAGFILIPNIASYVQGNLGYPRHQLGQLYMAGGVASFLSMRVIGYLVDRYGSFRVGAAGSALLVTVIYVFFYAHLPGFPVMAAFIAFMTAMAFRNVAYNTLTTKVPGPEERARFQSLQSSIQHGASAAGAFLSAQLLHEVVQRGPEGQPLLTSTGQPVLLLEGMPRVALVSMGLSVLVPVLLFWVENRLRRRDQVTLAAASSA